ncbi:MAG: ParB/RepB/Spo0J family partition protein [Candidatus Doudnabacteria bacterium]|nr:ParB/RepB/Spo0J family partition protein [Candidatus Doudnabacteria bacterium]
MSRKAKIMDEAQTQSQGMQSLTHSENTEQDSAVLPVSSTQLIAPPPSGHSLTEIPIDKISPNPWQPRKIFKQEYLQELANSIKEHGILQPLVVVPQPDGNYQIIVGERRWRASQLAGLSKVPVIVRDAMEEQQKLELALIENIQRHNLDAIEEAQAYQQLIDQYNLTQEEVAKKVGKGRTTVTNMIRLLNLPLKIQRAIADGGITEGHGRAILGLIGMEKQLALFDLVVSENMTVRQVEDRVREIMERPKQIKGQRPNADPELQAIETELRGKLGTKVRVQKNGDSGRITIDFFSQEELNSFLDKMHKLE